MTRDEKLRVLKRLWDKLLGELDHAARDLGNPRMKKLVIELRLSVPSAVKTAVLREYLKRCGLKHCIAFYQWRYMFEPPDLHDPTKDHYYNREEMVGNMKSLSEYFKKSIDITRKPKGKTTAKGAVDPKDDKDFQQVLGDPQEEIDKNLYTIVTFWQVGMADPFPDEQTQELGNQSMLGKDDISITDLVYPAYRYREGQSPNSMYIPGRHLLFKMMRATLGCRTEQDLWFNRHHDAHDCATESHSDHDHEHAAWDLEKHPTKHDSDGTPPPRDHTPRSESVESHGHH